MTKLEEHYNKFNEDKRLERRHGQVEYRTTMKYIHDCLGKLGKAQAKKSLKILEIGAGTGAYSLALAKEGYDVTAVELVRYNLGIMKLHARQYLEQLERGENTDKNSHNGDFCFQAYQGNALKLKRFADETFDLTLLFGPMYHLYTREEKIQALREARRVTKKGGYIMVAYLMNEYCVLTYAFKEGHVAECLANGSLDDLYKCHSNEEMLYDYVRLEEIADFNANAGLQRVKLISADGAADYMRAELKEMDEDTFEKFMEYHLLTCERPELLGACAHTVDILKREDGLETMG